MVSGARLVRAFKSVLSMREADLRKHVVFVLRVGLMGNL